MIGRAQNSTFGSGHRGFVRTHGGFEPAAEPDDDSEQASEAQTLKDRAYV
jgi:hypothetical protein